MKGYFGLLLCLLAASAASADMPGGAPPAPTNPTGSMVTGLGGASQRPWALYSQGCESAIFEAQTCAITGAFSNGDPCWAQYAGCSEGVWVDAGNYADVEAFVQTLQNDWDTTGTCAPMSAEHADEAAAPAEPAPGPNPRPNPDPRPGDPYYHKGGAYPWPVWHHPTIHRPTYHWSWDQLKSVTCTAKDRRGDTYPVVEEGYKGNQYKDQLSAIEDASLDRCYAESRDSSCSLMGCSPGY